MLSMKLSAIGKLYGSSYINEKFEKKLPKKLAGETYLTKNRKTLKSIVQARTAAFEINEKREVNTTIQNIKSLPIYVDDLKENPRKNFFQNVLELMR